jgi:hypothetical protein
MTPPFIRYIVKAWEEKQFCTTCINGTIVLMKSASVFTGRMFCKAKNRVSNLRRDDHVWKIYID